MIFIKTFQDLLLVGDNEQRRMDFVREVIGEHKSTNGYYTATIAQEYYKHKNTTITNYQKLLYTITGKAVPDNYSANYKLPSKFFYRFITQENQYLLGNGTTFENEGTKERLGKDFDIQVQKAGKYSLVDGLAFGFWNFDHLDVFRLTEFAPLYDENTGALRAGIRFWQIDASKPLRATLYEEDGYTEYIWNKRKTETDGRYEEIGQVLQEKSAYAVEVATSKADGIEIIDGANYPTFPIVPLWGNENHQSEIVGLREQIDCYDLIKSGFANTVDEASLIYWTLNNAGGMDDIDLAKFVERIKVLHAATTDDNVKAEPHSIEAPYQSREALLDRLRADLYEDAMALDTKSIVGGSNTATQIKANYEPLDDKCDDYEYQIKAFINGIMELAGIEDNVTFTRSKMINVAEDVGVVIQAAPYLSEDYVTKKILDIFGDSDQAQAILEQMDADSYGIYNEEGTTEDE